MNQQEKNEKLANDIRDFMNKHRFFDSRVYFNGKCYDWDSWCNMSVIEDMKGSTFFEYANDETVSMSFEGALNHILNGYSDASNARKIKAEFDKIFEKHKCYYEFGYAWSLSVYFD
jgi:hypothetical protein